MKITLKGKKLENEIKRHKVFMRSLFIMLLSKYIKIIQCCDDKVIPEFNSIDDLDNFYMDLTKGKYWLQKGFYLPRVNRNKHGIVQRSMRTIDGLWLSFSIYKSIKTVPVKKIDILMDFNHIDVKLKWWHLFKKNKLDKDQIQVITEQLFLKYISNPNIEDVKELIREAR